MDGAYILREDAVSAIKAYLKKKIDDGEMCLDTVDDGVELLRMICLLEGVGEVTGTPDNDKQ